MRRVVVGNLLCVGTHIKTGGAVRAAQPDTADLVAVDIAQRVAVQHVFEVCCRVARGEDGGGGHLADAVLVQQWQQRARALEWDMHGAVKLEKHMARIMDPETPQLAD